jgi:uncharacterized glyoxalase superfamily protein PhnB
MRMTDLIPMLPVRNMPAAVAFYARLGFIVASRNDDWRWAMLRFDDCRLMLDESINVHRDAPRQGVLYLYPDDLVAYRAMITANGIRLPPIEETFYGMKEFRIEDPDGNRLWIGQAPDDSK